MDCVGFGYAIPLSFPVCFVIRNLDQIVFDGKTGPRGCLVAVRSASDNVKVIFIAGYGRSGSTVLDRLLGQFDGFFSVGEINHIWHRGLEENQLCGCGEKFLDCRFWARILEEAFGSMDKFDPAYLARLHRDLTRMRYVATLVCPKMQSKTRASRIAEFSDVLDKLYGAIAKVSGASVIVDSSKNPAYGLIVSQLPGIDLRQVHLVRDSRAVAYSRQREKRRLEITDHAEYLRRMSVAESSFNWSGINFMAHMAGTRMRDGLRVRYEDLVENPVATVGRITEGLVDPAQVRERIGNSDQWDAPTHSVSGNPGRFERVIRLRLDSEWQRRMRIGPYSAVTLLTGPFLLLYGYSVFGGFRNSRV